MLTTKLKHIRAIVLLPVMATIIIPGFIIARTGSVHRGWFLPIPFHLAPVVLGIVLIGCGLILIVKTVSLLATIGQGTLAPWDPTRKLVVRGIYRYVRNPMISGVFCILLGETIFVGSIPLACWLILFILLNLIYIPLFEEPGLERRFGDDYRLYKQHVPRWIPRLRAWSAPWEGGADSVR